MSLRARYFTVIVSLMIDDEPVTFKSVFRELDVNIAILKMGERLGRRFTQFKVTSVTIREES